MATANAEDEDQNGNEATRPLCCQLQSTVAPYTPDKSKAILFNWKYLFTKLQDGLSGEGKGRVLKEYERIFNLR